MKVIGAGLSRTGTSSLNKALGILGYSTIHYDRVRLNSILAGTDSNPDFRIYDDVDAVTDIPSAFFYQELLEAYPESKVILTIRDADTWWKSFQNHITVRNPIPSHSPWYFVAKVIGLPRWPGRLKDRRIEFRKDLMNNVYGAAVPSEFLAKKKFNEHNERVISVIPSQKLLVMDITAGDGWEKLCAFLGEEIPDQEFPHNNLTLYQSNS